MRIVATNNSNTSFWFTVVTRLELGPNGPETKLVLLGSLNEIAEENILQGELAGSQFLSTGDAVEFKDIPDSEEPPVVLALGRLPPLTTRQLMTENEGDLLLMITMTDPMEEDYEPFEGSLLPPGLHDRPKDVIVRNGLEQAVCVSLLESKPPGYWPFPHPPPRMRSLVISSNPIPPYAYEGSSTLLQFQELEPGDAMTLVDMSDADGFVTMYEHGLCVLDEKFLTSFAERTLQILIIPVP